MAFLRLAAIRQHQRQRFAAQVRRRFAPAIGDRYGGGQRIAAAGKARLAEIDILHAVDKQRWLLPAGIAAGGHRQFAADVAGGQLRSQAIAQRQCAHRAGKIIIKSLPRRSRHIQRKGIVSENADIAAGRERQDAAKRRRYLPAQRHRKADVAVIALSGNARDVEALRRRPAPVNLQRRVPGDSWRDAAFARRTPVGFPALFQRYV